MVSGEASFKSTTARTGYGRVQTPRQVILQHLVTPYLEAKKKKKRWR